MEKVQKEMLEVLEDTVKFYNSTNRGYNEEFEICAYLDEKGNKCAVGRYLDINHPDYKQISKEKANIDTLFKDYEDFLIKNLPISFWLQLQKLHDESFNWDSEGLSDRGVVLYEEIKRSIENNTYRVDWIDNYL